MDLLYLRARTVRYIHLPGNLDPAAAIEAHRRAAAEALAAHRRHGHPIRSGLLLWLPDALLSAVEQSSPPQLQHTVSPVFGSAATFGVPLTCRSRVQLHRFMIGMSSASLWRNQSHVETEREVDAELLSTGRRWRRSNWRVPYQRVQGKQMEMEACSRRTMPLVVQQQQARVWWASRAWKPSYEMCESWFYLKMVRRLTGALIFGQSKGRPSERPTL